MKEKLLELLAANGSPMTWDELKTADIDAVFEYNTNIQPFIDMIKLCVWVAKEREALG